MRTLGLVARPYPMGRYFLTSLLINVDGVEHLGRFYTRGVWQVPADRPVSVAVAMRATGSRKYYGAAHVVLPPGAPTELEYKAPAFFDAPGALGPPGTVVHNGKDSHAKFVGIAVCVSIAFVALLVPVLVIVLR